MSGIVLSSSVRQNLLSLQSTAALLATTQNDLATGNKVNSALDNPTEFFTAQGLNNRASDISNLLDSINNGVQVLQAANTGITSLQGLISSAQSIANQVLQAPVGYSTKSSFSSAAITGATANNLLGTFTTGTNATVTGTAPLAAIDLSGTPATNGALTGTTPLGTIGASATGATLDGTSYAATDLSGANALTFDLTIDGTTKTINVTGADVTAFNSADTGTALQTVDATDLAGALNTAINAQFGTTTATYVSVDGTTGALDFASQTTGTTSNVSISNVAGTAAAATSAGIVNSTAPATGTAAGGALTAAFSFDVNGHAVSLASGSTYTAAAVVSAINTQLGTDGDTADAASLDTNGNLVIKNTGTPGTSSTVALTNFSGGTAADLGFASSSASGAAAVTATDVTFTVAGSGSAGAAQTVTLKSGSNYTAVDIVNAINDQVGTSAGVKASLDSKGDLVVTSTGTASATDAVTIGAFTDANAGAPAAAALLGLGTTATSVTASGTAPGTSPISGLELTIAATAGGTASDITFGTGTGQISTLNELNTALSSNNLQASIDSTGVITITTSNNAASSTIGQIGGTATTTGDAFALSNVSGPVEDPNSQATRASLVSQYNNVLDQITTTSQDSSFNGINLLNGDTLNLTFDETGASKLSISGVTFDTTGLGLSTLAVGTDFLDSSSANSVLSQLTAASTTLRTEASALGSNLSVVENRQDFNKNLINVLQTGASNLTLADPNEEAANSQALSTRQSIAVSALALANQSQQSVLQLLR